MDARGATAAESRTAQALIAGAFAVAVAAIIVVAFVEFGPLARHMAIHIATMNILAPLAAVAYRIFEPQKAIGSHRYLWIATGVQLALLWAWHSPLLHDLAHHSQAVGVALHATLFLAALAFWLAIIDSIASRWAAIAALLVTGKLACLLGALLIFAPRPLFGSGSHHHADTMVTAALDDQHLAGLLMVTACPLSFILTAIVLAAQAIADLQGAQQSSYAERRGHGD